MADRLFLLKPGFEKEDGNLYYCPSCATIEGFLGFFPRLRDLIDVYYLAFPRPRQPVIDLIGADNQSLPVLVLEGATQAVDPAIAVKSFNGNRFIDGEAEIRRYLSSRYDLPKAS